MSYVLAVDVGTSFTAAAVARFDQGASSSPECLPLGLRGTSVPSVLFFPEEGPLLVGEAAERRGLDSPGRVVREFKRRVGDAVPISAGTLSLPAEEVFATMARWVADRAEEREGAPPSEIILTHPAAWGIHRTSLIKDALAAKGLENVTLLTEPEAAALHYASQVRVEDGSIIAVYDLGGGTFDTAVLRKAASDRFELLGQPEGFEYMGGADFDAALFRYVAEHTGGALETLDPAAPGVLASLARLRRECVEAKEALSSDSEANISVLLPGIHQQVRLVRPEFEALIEDSVRDTVDALEQSLGQLGLEPADLTAVLLIGGSSRIPLVAQLISEQLDRPIAVDADPKSSICLGATVSAVLEQAAAAEAAAAADSLSQDALQGSAPVPAPMDGHVPLTLASWSRNATSTRRSGAAAATAPGHGEKGGAHAPKPRVRLTAVAATAVLFTVLSANAAQSPEGFNSLTSVFVPPAGASDDLGTLPPPETGGAGGTGAAAGPAIDTQVPIAGLESGVERVAASQAPVLTVEATPTDRVASIRAIEKEAAGETPTGSATAPPASSSSTAAEIVPPTESATPTVTAPETTTSTGSPTTSDTQPGTATASPSATPSTSATPSRSSATGTPGTPGTSGPTSPSPSGATTTSQALTTEPTPSPTDQVTASPLSSSTTPMAGTTPATTTTPAA
ncbi:molecular chaperone DnaK [Arthrobacter sp. AFG7.2]|uniref:Hsp70 family protein n=1 Tax=Arthrobacter sp. AFG7.2 TaxID=1688693 RepID=UPI000C9E4027|nr:Hsp70 family protein [Arthrobacter sp. AFG7.2]PNI07083.1 molecular chaperone DnaK [Arthrobacter sp. AFG7.2]